MSTVEARLRERISTLEEEIRQLREVLQSKYAPYARLGLSRQMQVIMDVLMRNDVATGQILQNAMEADKPSPSGRINDHYRTVIAQMRKRLAPHGVAIDPQWGQGVSLNPEAKARVRELCGLDGRP